METRMFGRTGMRLSILGFGCGAVGGLMVRGDPRDQERTIARALAAGVNYFDTAVQYGNGESEKNLGRVLQNLKPANVVVGTKVRLPSSDFGRIANAVAKSLEASLARLKLDCVDIFHLHNAITESGGGEALSVAQVLGEVVPAFERLRQQGKTRFLGITAVGETAALRHAIASPPLEPIGSGLRYEADIGRARRLMPLVNDGFAASLTEAATRFAISHPAVGTILVGMATPQQFDDALAAVEKGPLPATALARLSAL